MKIEFQSRRQTARETQCFCETRRYSVNLGKNVRKDQPVLGMLCKQTTKGNQGKVGHQINNLHVGYRYRSSRHRHSFVSFHFLTTKLSHDSYTVTTTLLLKS